MLYNCKKTNLANFESFILNKSLFKVLPKINMPIILQILAFSRVLSIQKKCTGNTKKKTRKRKLFFEKNKLFQNLSYLYRKGAK